MPRVLVADDDPTVQDVLSTYLRHAGIEPVTVGDGDAALRAVAQGGLDAVVLDIMMGPPDGLEVCRALRADPATERLPIMLLTALGEELDRITGFETGADDYVTKPFSPRELVLRIQSLLRRSAGSHESSTAERLVSGDIEVDLPGRRAWRRGTLLSLTTREFDLLAHFAANPGQTYSREQLMRQVWGWTFGDESTVTVHVRRLREKIEDVPSKPTLLATVWGAGYRWDAA